MYTLATQKVIQNYYQNSQEEEQLLIKRFLCIVASYLKPNIYNFIFKNVFYDLCS